jgi:hypothetical protein
VAAEVSHYQLLADLVLTIHLAIVVFVVAGLAIIVVGNLSGWSRINAPLFRVTHLAAIGVVVAQAWFGAACPVTSLEMWLRTQAQASTYSGSFIEHWVHRVLYYQAPSWVFTLIYTLFGLAVLAAWWLFPPMFKRRASDPES